MKRQPIGIDDFKKIIENDLYFVDKSLLIKEVIDDSSEVVGSLLSGDVKTFYKIFATTIERTLSFHDVGEDKSESFYHAFVLGMLVYIDKDYEIRSNRESGFGRYDVMIIPKDRNKKGFSIEFKKVDKFDEETFETALEAALKQIEEKKYDCEIKALGVHDIVKIAISFKGKEVKIATA